MSGTAVGSGAGLLFLCSPAGHFLCSYLCSPVLMLNSAPWRSTPMLLLPQCLQGCACCIHHAYVLPLPGSAESAWSEPRRGRVTATCSRETDPVVLTMLSLLGYGCPLEWAEFGIKLGFPIPLSRNTLQQPTGENPLVIFSLFLVLSPFFYSLNKNLSDFCMQRFGHKEYGR